LVKFSGWIATGNGVFPIFSGVYGAVFVSKLFLAVKFKSLPLQSFIFAQYILTFQIITK